MLLAGCLKCISGINLSPTNKNVITISFIIICIQNKISPSTGILLNGVLMPKLLNNPFASCFLINLDFLLPHITHFDIMTSLPLLVLETCGSIASYTLSNTIPFFINMYCSKNNSKLYHHFFLNHWVKRDLYIQSMFFL